jgi:hypothetical protein
LFSWQHEPISPAFDVGVPNEIALSQLVSEHRGNTNRCRWHEYPPEVISGNYLLCVETYVLPDMKDMITQALPTAGPLAKPPLAAAMTADEVEDGVAAFQDETHEMKLPLSWEQQTPLIDKASGREMVEYLTEEKKDGVVFVKFADGSPPDPGFVRVMMYVLGGFQEELQIRAKKGESV